MEAIIKGRANVRNYHNILSQIEKNKRRSKMSESTSKVGIVEKIARGIALVFLIIIIILAVILFITKNLLIVKALLVIGSLFLLACLVVLALKYTGFYEIINIKNPEGFRTTDVAIVFGIVGVFSLLIPATYGMLFIPEFMLRVQTFMSNQQELAAKSGKILEGLEKLFLTPPPQ